MNRLILLSTLFIAGCSNVQFDWNGVKGPVKKEVIRPKVAPKNKKIVKTRKVTASKKTIKNKQTEIITPQTAGDLDTWEVKVPGYEKVTGMYANGVPVFTFEPFIPRDDKELELTVRELSKITFGIELINDPAVSMKSFDGQNWLHFKYENDSIMVLPYKNDDGTIHAIMMFIEK